MTTLETKVKELAGQTNILPIVGEVEISSDCTIQVEDDGLAQELAALNIGWTIVGTVAAPKKKADPIKPQIEKGGNLGTEEGGDKIVPQTQETPDPLGKGENAPEPPAGETSDEAKQREAAVNARLSNEPLEVPIETELSSLTVPKLQELAASFPKEEWKSLKKEDLVNYLVNKLEETK